MNDMFMGFTSLVALTHKLLRRGGMKALVAENLLLKQQLFLLTRSRKRAPNGIGANLLTVPYYWAWNL